MRITSVFTLLFFFLVSSAAFSEVEQQMWGDAGSILDFDRIKEGAEASLPGKTNGQSLDEIERWLSNQNAYVSFNYRYKNVFEFGSDFTIDLKDTDSTTLQDLVKVLYVSASPADWLNITFGKQRLKWGTAKVFNAIDKLESVNNPVGARSFREGVTGIKAVLTPLDWLSVSLLGLPERKLRWTRLAGRLDVLFLDIDLGIGVLKYNYNNIDSINTAPTPPAAVSTMSDRAAVFLDAIRYFDNVGIYAESEYCYSRGNEYAFADLPGHYQVANDASFIETPVIRLTCGLSYSFNTAGNTTLLLEYFYNGEGFSNDEAKAFCSGFAYHLAQFPTSPLFLPQGFGFFGSFRKHYLCLSLTRVQVADCCSLDLTALSNPETLSFCFAPQLTFDVNKIVFISIKYEFFHQFLDKDSYPSDLNFNSYNHRLTFSASTSFVSKKEKTD